MVKPKIIISLTSFPRAIDTAHTAIKSILNGSVTPDKVVLYLAEGQFPDRNIPAKIEALRADEIFEVRWTEQDTRSYKKLVPALTDFPDDIVITADDDILYPRRMVERLLFWHQIFPKAIVAHRCRRIKFNGLGEPMPYKTWSKLSAPRLLRYSFRPSYRNLATTGSGALYPPHSLDEAMLDPALFTTVAPTVDDIWFWAAATSAGTKIAQVPCGYTRLREVGKPFDLALYKINAKSGADVNRDTTRAILERYPMVKKRLTGEEK